MAFHRCPSAINKDFPLIESRLPRPCLLKVNVKLLFQLCLLLYEWWIRVGHNTFFGTTISSPLKWEDNLKKANHRLFFLRQMRKSGASKGCNVTVLQSGNRKCAHSLSNCMVHSPSSAQLQKELAVNSPAFLNYTTSTLSGQVFTL